MIDERIWSQADAYVASLFGIGLDFEAAPTGRWPTFLADKYAFRIGRLFGRPLVLMAIDSRKMESPAVVAKHLGLARSFTDDPVVLLTDALGAQNRQRLLQLGVNFIIPGNQFFVLDFGIDLREHFRSAGRERADHLTPAAQVMVLACLLHGNLDSQTPKTLAQRFHYSQMSAGRAVDELKQYGLVEVQPRGRERQVRFPDDLAWLWREARPRLQSPVRTTRDVHNWPSDIPAPLAGESALSDYTELGPPRRPVVAVSSRRWKTLVYDHALEPADPHDPGAVEVQSWSYDPRALSHADPAVDRLSLFLSLENRHEDRVRQAADALLEPFPWS